MLEQNLTESQESIPVNFFTKLGNYKNIAQYIYIYIYRYAYITILLILYKSIHRLFLAVLNCLIFMYIQIIEVCIY